MQQNTLFNLKKQDLIIMCKAQHIRLREKTNQKITRKKIFYHFKIFLKVFQTFCSQIFNIFW